MSSLQDRQDQPTILFSLWRGRVARYKTMRDIIQATADKHGLTVEDMLSKGRKRRLAWARQEAMYEMHLVGKWSYPQIARAMGGLDHTTAIHAVRAHKRRLGVDKRLKA